MTIESLLPGFSGVMEPIITTLPQLNPEDYWYEVKWDGVRLVVIIDYGKVTVINRHGRDKSVQFPEFMALPNLLRCNTAVIEGEGVVIQISRRDFPALIKRNNRCSGPNLQTRQGLPLTYMLFDLLAIDGQEILSWSYEERKQRLQELLEPTNQFQLVEGHSNGGDLWAAVQMLNLEGMVAKKRGSPYRAGKKHASWYKIKHRRQEWCVIGGYTEKQDQINALLLGQPREGKLRYCGRVGLSGEVSRQAWLGPALQENRCVESPFANGIKIDGVYITPVLEALVEFAEWTPELKLRQPVLKDIRPLNSMVNEGVE